jgi:hypothetical protein
MKTLYGVYRAVCLSIDVDGGVVRCHVPQVFADETVTCLDVTGDLPSTGESGWVSFESGFPDRPVWLSAGGGSGGGGGTDEVWVGPSEPGSTIELWYDTDELADPDTARWNSAWGAVGTPVHSTTTHTSNTTTFTAIPGVAVTWTPVAGRRYKLTATVDWRLQASPAPAFYIRFSTAAGPAVFNSLRHAVAVNGGYGTTTLVQPAWTFTAGVPVTMQVQVQSSTYPVDFNQYGGSTFIVEDIGPVSPATAPAAPASVWTNVTFQNGWTNYGGTNQTVQYRMFVDLVQIRGAMKDGTNSSTAFTLPVGYRPPANTSGLLVGGGMNVEGVADILTDGSVNIYATAIGLVRFPMVQFSVTP